MLKLIVCQNQANICEKLDGSRVTLENLMLPINLDTYGVSAADFIFGNELIRMENNLKQKQELKVFNTLIFLHLNWICFYFSEGQEKC